MALRINSTLVTHSDLYQEMDQLKAVARQRGESVNCCERDQEFMAYARDNMIARVLLTEEADRRGVTVPDAEVEAQFARIVAEAGGEEHFYINHNSSADQVPQFKAGLGINLRLQRVLDEAVGPSLPPTDAEIEAYYRANLERFMTPRRIRVSHMLKTLDHGANARAAYDELAQVRALLVAGGEGVDFAKLVQAHCDRKDNDGDLGFFARGELVEEFEAVVFSINVGEISPVFLSPFGYHIAKVTDQQPPTPRPLDEIRDQVAQQLRDETHQTKMRAFVDALKAGATIEDVDDAPAETAATTHTHETGRTIDDEATT